MLYVVLFFHTCILHEKMGTMREIVDKFFSDNWVINIYMGVTMDLNQEWQHFTAARTALENVLQTNNVKLLTKKNVEKITQCYSEEKNISIIKPSQISMFLIIRMKS